MVGTLEERKAAFLEALAETRNVTHASRAIGVSRESPRKWRKADPEFDKECLKHIKTPGECNPTGKGGPTKGVSRNPHGVSKAGLKAKLSTLEIKHMLARRVYEAGLGDKLVEIVENANASTREGKKEVLAIARFVEVPLMPKESALDFRDKTTTDERLAEMGDLELMELVRKRREGNERMLELKAKQSAITAEYRDIPSDEPPAA